MGCLLRLRDLVAHRNARLQNFGDVPEHISDCVRQGVIPINAEQAEWTRMTLISAVAKWSSETAENWLKIAEELIPLRC